MTEKIKEVSFEKSLIELEKIINEMEQGSIDDLDKLIENYENGSKLIERCNKILKDAELKVQKITQKIEKEARD
ncbi:MAG: exodeoxyribonuclease VII small subunit [Candidatus Cloacimonetes bacterium]|jgi:exodeoxyribonuclease VII small subunit|nr:exodeoxyribonuclease VII small subunit [Candidatus Cloacimonadota bacterium]MDD4156656.1 exodeoxyribonuclease VII small subunit [Candidatus Cloacimonadota bacterium]